jgi:cephalosporin hydroxylase
MNWAEANRAFFDSGVWRTLFDDDGRRICKYPTDLIAYDELLRRVQPEVIVETGSAEGGSAVWFSRYAEVISVDVKPPPFRHPGVTFVAGDSTDNDVIALVTALVEGRRCLVSMDSDHSAAHVKRELALYSRFVPKGSYLVVEDTAVDAYGIESDSYPEGGPLRAVEAFMEVNRSFTADPEPQRFFLGMNPGGWLRRTA